MSRYVRILFSSLFSGGTWVLFACPAVPEEDDNYIQTLLLGLFSAFRILKTFSRYMLLNRGCRSLYSGSFYGMTHALWKPLWREPEFLNFKELRNRFQGTNSASLWSLSPNLSTFKEPRIDSAILCSLAGRYVKKIFLSDRPKESIPTW
jgi:hypothetical protein